MEKSLQKNENKMGVMPVNKLLLSMSVPIMISMMVQALYNIVDSMFVAKISEDALTAVSLAFPVQNLMIAVASGTGVGMNALLSRSLGEKNTEAANKAANNGIVLAFGSFVVFALLTGFFGEVFFKVQTDNADIIRYGTEYIRICGIVSFGLFFQIVFERLLQSTGKTICSMISQLSGAIINIILDPIMIFGLFGFPKMGVAGAAAATVMGQIAAAIIGYVLNAKVNKELTISVRKYKPSFAVIKNIYSVGIPSIIMSSIGSIMTFGMNKILLAFSSTAAAVFGVYFKLQSFIFMPIFGLNNGMVPIVAYNYGARKPKRITEAIRLGILYAITIMVIGVIIFQCTPEQLLAIFSASEDMLAIGVPALRIISVHFVVAAAGIVFSSVFQALGSGVFSLIMSVMRQLVVLLPSAYILARVGGLSAIWWSFLIAEVVSLTLAIIFFCKLYKERIKPLGKN